MICVDGGQGLLAALPMVYPGIPVHWANKIRNVFDKVSHLASGSYRDSTVRNPRTSAAD